MELKEAPISAPPLTDRSEDALEKLVREHHASVTRLAFRLLGWRGDIEDLVHDVFLTAFKKIDRFRNDSSTWTWLAAITINRVRSQRRQDLLHFRWLKRRGSIREAATRLSSSKSSGNPVEQDETAKRVRAAVAKLSPRDRELIVLHYLEELPIPEICKLLDARDTTIHVRLHRARQRLKEFLEDER